MRLYSIKFCNYLKLQDQNNIEASPEIAKFAEKTKSRLQKKPYLYRKFEKQFNDNIVIPELHNK